MVAWYHPNDYNSILCNKHRWIALQLAKVFFIDYFYLLTWVHKTSARQTNVYIISCKRSFHAVVNNIYYTLTSPRELINGPLHTFTFKYTDIDNFRRREVLSLSVSTHYRKHFHWSKKSVLESDQCTTATRRHKWKVQFLRCSNKSTRSIFLALRTDGNYRLATNWLTMEPVCKDV